MFHLPFLHEVMSFYELYHAVISSACATPESISGRFLYPRPCRFWCLMRNSWPMASFSSMGIFGIRAPEWPKAKSLFDPLGPWAGPSSLDEPVDLAECAWSWRHSWIAAADYYRFPHVQYFHSVASLVQQLQSLSPATVATSMRRASQKIQSQTLAAYRQVLQHVLGFGHIYDSSDSSCPFANILKVFCAYQWSYIEATFGPYWLDMIGLFATRGSRQLSKLRGNWNQMQLGGTLQEWLHHPGRLPCCRGTQVSDLEVS